MTFEELQARAMAIRKLYAEYERKLYGQSWTTEDLALGFVGDVGDLAKLVMAEVGHRNIPDARAKLEHELADCLWSLMALANACNVDLEKSFLRTMDDLEGHLTKLEQAE